jgi:hypothetical protein
LRPEIIFGQERFARDETSSFDKVFQFANISRPRQLLQVASCLRGDGDRGHMQRIGSMLQKVIDYQGDVFSPLM